MPRIKTLPILALVLAGVAAVAMIAVLQQRSDESRQAQVDLGLMSAKLNERTMVPLGVMFGAPPVLVRLQMAKLKADIQGTAGRLHAETPMSSLDQVDIALASSFAAGESVLQITTQMATSQGRNSVGSAIAGNDPELNHMLVETQESGSALTVALDVARAEYAERAQRARRQATIGTAGAIALLILAFAIAYRRSLRAQGAAERLAAENASMADASQREALTDALTDLGNRRALVAELDAALESADTEPVILALFDLDGFKHYNDTFGHQAGDALLRRLGERLRERLDGRASAFRMGGDEFCVLARVEGQEAMAVARDGAEALTEHGEGFSIGCSYGVALAPSEASTAEDVLRIADQRMYERKSAGPRVSATQQATDVLLQVLVERDGELAEHGDDVARLATATAKRLGVRDFELRQVELAAQLHDIGKSAVPASILDKPGPLDAEEWAFMRRHTVIGERIVRAAPSLAHAAPLIRSSHERIDGTGYPDGLRGDEIPLGARIVAVCDAFDAMVTDRPYRPGMDIAAALAESRRCAGTQFDADVVAAFCALAEQLFVAPTRPSP